MFREVVACYFRIYQTLTWHHTCTPGLCGRELSDWWTLFTKTKLTFLALFHELLGMYLFFVCGAFCSKLCKPICSGRYVSATSHVSLPWLVYPLVQRHSCLCQLLMPLGNPKWTERSLLICICELVWPCQAHFLVLYFVQLLPVWSKWQLILLNLIFANKLFDPVAIGIVSQCTWDRISFSFLSFFYSSNSTGLGIHLCHPFCKSKYALNYSLQKYISKIL